MCAEVFDNKGNESNRHYYTIVPSFIKVTYFFLHQPRRQVVVLRAMCISELTHELVRQSGKYL